MHRVNKVSAKIPPRKFPKKQYRKFNRHFWTIIIGIIVIIILAGMAGAGIILKTSVNNQPVHHHVKYVRMDHYSKSTRHPNYVKITPKRGEKLLGHWLIKLHYPPAKSQTILTRYQKSNGIQEETITKKLIKLNNKPQISQIRKLINDLDK